MTISFVQKIKIKMYSVQLLVLLETGTLYRTGHLILRSNVIYCFSSKNYFIQGYPQRISFSDDLYLCNGIIGGLIWAVCLQLVYITISLQLQGTIHIRILWINSLQSPLKSHFLIVTLSHILISQVPLIYLTQRPKSTRNIFPLSLFKPTRRFAAWKKKD